MLALLALRYVEVRLLRSCLWVSLGPTYCVWVRSVIGCAGVGLARAFPFK